MSRLHPSWPIWLIALIIAVGGPALLLREAPVDIVLPPRPTPMNLKITAVMPMDQAQTQPLFVAGRQIIDGQQEALEEAEYAGAEAQSSSGAAAPTLLGVVRSSRGKAAAILRTSNGEQHMVKQGASLEGWQVQSVGKDKVTIAGNGQTQTLTLDFSASAMGGASNTEAPQPSAAQNDSAAKDNDTSTEVPL